MTFPGYETPLVGEHLLRALRDLEVRHVFSIPGAQILPVWDGFHRVVGIDLVVPHSETSGAFMAEGYGRVAPVPAAVINTLGVGVANEIPAAVSALRSATPVLFVSPRQPGASLPGSLPQPRVDKRARRGSVFQGLAHPSLLDLHAKKAFAPESQLELWCCLPDALAVALAPPAGPVRVHVPYPLLFDRAEPQPAPAPPARPPRALAGVLALEAQGMGESWKKRIFPGAAPEVHWPGIARAGYGMPFALGARLARPGVPVVLVTTPEGVLGAVDCVGLARSRGITVHVAEIKTIATPVLKNAAGLLDATYHLGASDAALQQLVAGDPDAWLLLCP